jgi:hypothetical protein
VIRCFGQALELWRDAGERFFEATTLTHLGDSQEAVGDTGSARSTWLRAAAILDDLAHPDAGPVRARLHAAPALTRTEPDGAAARH